jgi:hypothetical protein
MQKREGDFLGGAKKSKVTTKRRDESWQTDRHAALHIEELTFGASTILYEVHTTRPGSQPSHTPPLRCAD